MSTPTLFVILGNRPQFIKHAALQPLLAARSDLYQTVIIDTGQHYDYALAGIFVDELQIPKPDYSLGVGSASHAEQLSRMMPPLEGLMRAEKPFAVVVYGDTNSTLGGALVAAQLQIPVVHVEAGLRSFDRTMPEEINRVLVDHLATLLLCPTDQSVKNCLAEGLTAGVHRVGDVMADIAIGLADAADGRWADLEQRFELTSGEYGLVTIHRAANTEQAALAEIIDCLRAADIPLVFPIHPRTQAALEQTGLHVALTEVPNLQVIPPLGYLDLAAVLRKARCVLTDSGGLQKEAYIHGIPCITLRDTSEWVETLETGMNVLVERSAEQTAAAIANLAHAPERATLPALYGTGEASAQIVELIETLYTGSTTVLL